jgi:hypothetical protein
MFDNGLFHKVLGAIMFSLVLAIVYVLLCCDTATIVVN